MNPLNPFAISGLLIVAFYTPLSLFIFIKGKTKIARIYGCYLFSIAMWGIGVILIGTIKDPLAIKLIWKLAYSCVLFIPPFFYHTIYEMTGRKSKWDLFIVYSQAVIFTITVFQDTMISDFRIVFKSFYFHIATPTFTASFIVWSIIISTGHLLLINAYNKMFPNQKTEIKNILYLTLIGFIGGVNNFLPPYGWNIYPWGNFIIIAPCIAISHAIFKYQFLDIKIVIKKSLAYSLLILLAALLYFGIVVVSEKFIQGFWGYKSITASILTAFTIGIMFFPLHNRIQELVDRIIFKRTTEEISKENELLRAEVLKTEKLKSVAILASGMAHEIRNPLTALKTFSEYLPNKLDDKEFLKKFSKIVGSEVDRIDGLVTQLLEFAKPSPVQLQKSNINKLIKETLDFLSNKFIDHKIQIAPELTVECDEPILIDPSKMRQVFLNLFLNSIEAMKDGGILEIASRLSDSRNDGIDITITDTGCGITKENLTHIFDPFFSTKDTGTGLGLPITYGIIKEHGGEIKVESKIGKGTTFTIKLSRIDITR